VLLVFAKDPRPGLVKTRMTPPLEPELAAELYAHLLDDVLAASADAAPLCGLELVLAVHPPDAVRALAERAPAGYRVIAQRGPDLGARMSFAVAEAAAGGFDPVLLRGSDSPALTAATLREAVQRLERADLVVCPDRDGGYNLIGLHLPVPGLFSHNLSTNSALDDMLAEAARHGLRTERLEAGFDLDTAGDFAWLAAARARGDALPCPRTLAFLDEHGLWRHVAEGR
jgi:rSAM/selenodomain-associated transferase 1